MDSVKQFNFTLKCTNKLSSSKYLQIKANIEQICNFALHQSKKYSLNNVAIAIRTDPKLHMSVYVKDGQVSFGVFSAHKNKIYLSVEDTYFNKLSFEDYEKFQMRIENYMIDLSKGIPLHVDNLLRAWEECLNPQIPPPGPGSSR